MATQKQKLTSGLFIVTAITLLVATVAIIEGNLGEPTETVRVQFPPDMSVGGLSKGAPVKFKGVPIGKVEHIELKGGDNPHAEAILEIERRAMPYLGPDVHAELVWAGITGALSIDLSITTEDGRAGQGGSRVATTAPWDRVIQAERSGLGLAVAEIPQAITEVRQFVARMNVVIDQNKSRFASMLAAVDLLAAEAAPRLVTALDELDRLMRYAEARVLAPDGALDRVEGTLERNLDRMTREVADSADQVAANVSRTLAATEDPTLRTLDALQVALVDLRTLIIEMHGLLAGNREALGAMLAEMRDAAEAVEEVMLELKADPSSLIFGEPKKDGREP